MGRLAKWILYFSGDDEDDVTPVTVATTATEEEEKGNPETEAEQE